MSGDSEQDGNAGRMSIQEVILGLMLLLGIGAAIGVRSGYLHTAPPPHQTVLEVILAPEHGGLLCDKGSGEWVPCTVAFTADGWLVRFTEPKK